MSPGSDTVPTLLTVDFPGRREEGWVTDLELERHGFAVQHLLSHRLPSEVTGRAYAERLLADVDLSSPVVAVVGYCLAGPLTHEVAAVVAKRTAWTPSLVLVDVGPGRAEAVADAYREALAQFPTSERPGRADRTEIATRVSTEPRRLIEDMRADLRQRATAALVADGEEPGEAALIADDMVHHHLGWIVHLVAAANCDLPELAGGALHVMSKDHPFEGSWPNVRAYDSRRFDVERSALLRRPDVAAFVASWVAAAGSTLAGEHGAP